MKPVHLIVCFLLIGYKPYSQFHIKGSLSGYSGDSILIIRKPVNGYFNNVSYETKDTIPISGNQFSFKIDCKKPVFIFVSFSGQCVKMVATPGDSVTMNLDFTSYDKRKKVHCTFKGANSSGHELFYDYDYNPVEKYHGVWTAIKEQNDERVISKIKETIEKAVSPFSNLYTKGLIDTGYYELMRITITALLLHEPIRRLADHSISNITLPIPSRLKIANQLFRLLSPYDPELCYGVNTYLYAISYFAFQRSARLNTKGIYDQPDTTISYSYRSYKITGPFASLISISDQTLKEYLFASYLLACLSVGAEEALKDEIEYFKASHPRSEFVQVITTYKKTEEIRKDIAEKNYQKYYPEMTSTFLDTVGKIKDFSFSNKPQFKNKLLYVDLWATWCAPCIQEMQYNFRPDSLFYSKGVQRIYISIDNPSQKGKWEAIIRKYHLGGYHILAGNDLNKFISKTIGLSEGLVSIPRYLFIKNGEILVSDANRPSDFENLSKQTLDLLK